MGLTRAWRWWLRTKPDFLDKPLLAISAVMVTVMVVWGVRIDSSAQQSSAACKETANFAIKVNKILDVTEDRIRKSAVLSPADKASGIAQYEDIRFQPIHCP